VDVHADVALGIFPLQVEELRHDQVRNLVVNRRPQEHDPLFQEEREDIEGPLGTRAGFDHRRNDGPDKRIEWGLGLVHAVPS
jgi:hypothetical protein